MSRGFGFAEDASLQATTLAVFTVLQSLRSDWGGALIVSCGLGPLGQAVALAANVSGAACLSIEPDAAACRAAMRAGACDFLVNTVDESLRVLKNEIRKRQPVSVALEIDRFAALEELVGRGVLPALFTAEQTSPEITSAGDAFRQDGAELMELGGGPSSWTDAAGLLKREMEERGWSWQTLSAPDAAAIKALDARLLGLIPLDDSRRAWVTAAPRLFHRDRPYRRAVLLTAAEQAAFA